MNDDGYTLVEMLVALVLAGLAVSVMSTTARIVSRTEGQQRAMHVTSVSLGRLTNAVGEALRAAGPFASAGFVGSPEQAAFDCGEGRCALDASPAMLRFGVDGAQRSYAVPRVKHPSLSYVSAVDGRASATWPPADRGDRLAMVVVADSGKPIVNLPVGREQSSSCVFDVSAKGCAMQVRP